MNKTGIISSPDGVLTLGFNNAGDILRFQEALPSGDVIDYFHRPQGNRNPVMHPWCNRVEGGTFSFGGEALTLRPLHGMENNALHGNWLSPWSLCEQGDNYVEFNIRAKAADVGSDPQKITPYYYDLRQRLSLDNGGLSVTLHLVNRGRMLPFGIGLHPFFPRPQDTVLKVAVKKMENCRADMIPDQDKPLVPVPADWTLTEGFVLSNENLAPARQGFGRADLMDNCFPGIDPAEGATIVWPGFGEEGREMKITASANCSFAVCFVPGKANDVPAGDLSFFCFELTTNGINMQNRPDAGGVVLKSGESLSATTRFAIAKLQP